MTRAAALRARQRAAEEMPTPDELAGMAAGIPAAADMSPAEIRRVAAAAISNAQQINYLLGRLATLLDEESGDPR